jgi:hypothetical protein
MFDEEEIKSSHGQETKRERAGKYKALPRNRKTERDLQRIFDYGTEAELTKYLRENGVPDGSTRFAQIVKIFHEHGGKQR